MTSGQETVRTALPSSEAAWAESLRGRLLDGRYRVGERIARGGMASVYEATDIRLDRTVAVKVMHPGLGDDDEFAARFVREARSAARLSHPHVVSVFDQGSDAGTVFLVMEHVPGKTLRDVIREEAPLPPARALALMEPVVSALAAAHRAGMIHRDVKPENVLIRTRDVESQSAPPVKVADFGLAKAVSADTQHTVTGGVLIGTVSYLAPELVVDGRADARADVYAAGVVLYELLTGTKPHEGESPIAVAYKHVHTDVPPPSAAVPGIPDYLDALVARATSRDRTQRPADAAVLLHQLHRVEHAVREGVGSDPDLAADLRPRPVASQDTTPDPVDLEAFAAYAQDIDSQPPVVREQEPQVPVVVGAVAALPPAHAVVTTLRPRRRRGPLLVLLALLLVAGLGFAAYWYGTGRYTTTPGVIGLEEQAAVAKLEQAGLAAETGEPEFSETVPAGVVLRTDPEAGSRILSDGTVTLIVSLGKERYAVPPVKGMTEDQAQDALREANLAFGSTEKRWNETVPAGTVLRSDPPAGKELKRDTPVTLFVSKGRKPIEVTDFTGKDAAVATRELEEQGLEVRRAEDQFSDSVPIGRVISQSPDDGTLFRGDVVTLTVSKGPEMVAVPDGLVASGVEAARAALEAVGFDVEVEEGPSYLGLGFVMDVDPGEGEMIPKGSTVTLYLV